MMRMRTPSECLNGAIDAMPVNGKRSRDSEGDNKESKKQRHERVLCEYDYIGYSADQWHTLIRSIPEEENELTEIVSRVVCSFLNGFGGILCFGCRSNGKIYGDIVSRKEEDNLRLIMDDVLKRFHPFLSPSHYRINFTPIKSLSSQARCIVEVKVELGDHYELYETELHEVYLRGSKGSPYGPLTPHEIKRHVVQQYRKKLQNEVKQCNYFKLKKGDSAQSKGHLINVTTPINKGHTNPHPLCVYRSAIPVKRVMRTVSKPSSVTVTVSSATSTSTVGISLPQCAVTTPTITTTVTHSSSSVADSYKSKTQTGSEAKTQTGSHKATQKPLLEVHANTINHTQIRYSQPTHFHKYVCEPRKAHSVLPHYPPPFVYPPYQPTNLYPRPHTYLPLPHMPPRYLDVNQQDHVVKQDKIINRPL